MESHNPNDEKYGWCANCNQFSYAEGQNEPVHFNAIVSDLQAKVRSHMASGSPFSLQFEQFTDNGQMCWRALIKLGNNVWKHSHRKQATPTDALRELYELMEAGHA